MTMSVPEVRFQPSGNYEDALARAAGECGIDREYWDIFHKRHETSHETLRRVLCALGWDLSSHDAIENIGYECRGRLRSVEERVHQYE